MDIEQKFQEEGFVVIEQILKKEELCLLSENCDSQVQSKIGTRNLLEYTWARDLAQKLLLNQKLRPLLPNRAVAVQCNYFVKDAQNNWSVTLHRDLSIPVKKKVDTKGWSGWSQKEGVLFVQPPRHVLEEMVAVRIHMEDNTSDNGALELVAGSHKSSNPTTKRRVCSVSEGGALVMRPLLLHASTKLRSGKRRVLHFVFGPKELPNQVEWAAAICLPDV